MTTTVERTYHVAAPIEDVWALIADPGHRASAISVVERYEKHDDVTIWHLSLPIRFVPGSIRVRTWDVERDPPRYVRFVGESRVMDVEGEHELTETAEGTSVTNRFRVDGKLPGVERFFEHNIDGEIERMVALARDRLSLETEE